MAYYGFRNLVDGYRTVYETSRQHHAVSVTDLLHERTDIEIIEIAAELVGNTLETASPRTQTSASSSISSQQERRSNTVIVSHTAIAAVDQRESRRRTFSTCTNRIDLLTLAFTSRQCSRIPFQPLQRTSLPSPLPRSAVSAFSESGSKYLDAQVTFDTKRQKQSASIRTHDGIWKQHENGVGLDNKTSEVLASIKRGAGAWSFQIAGSNTLKGTASCDGTVRSSLAQSLE